MDAKIQQFLAVTGSSEQVARSLLEACGGNLDLAVSMHLEGGEGQGPGQGPSAVATRGASSEKSYEEM